MPLKSLKNLCASNLSKVFFIIIHGMLDLTQNGWTMVILMVLNPSLDFDCLLNQEQATDMDWTLHTDLWKSENLEPVDLSP